MVIHTKKQVKTKTIHKRMDLPQSLRDKIDEFWKKQVKVNPNLFNGEVWNVTKMEENKDNILLTIEKTDYAHYLYDERHGIEEKYACHNLAGGTYIVTKDGYAVIGELDDTTSYPRMMQVSGGGIDKKYDIENDEFDLIKTAKSELKEELNLDLNDKEQIESYNFEYIEKPEGKRHSYCVILKAYSMYSKDQLEEHFNKYYQFLEETDDVDLYVTQNSFDKLSKKFNVHISGKPFPNHYTVNEKTEAVLVKDLQNEKIYNIDGYPCRSIIDDYNWYRQNGRPKDLASADKIDAMFENIAKEYNCKKEDVTENEICKYVNK